MKSFSFDQVATCYDLLAQIVFGNAIDKAQKHFFPLIPERSSILIIGGGSGRILSDLIENLQPQKITFVEASSNMLRKAQSRSSKIFKKKHYDTELTFIHGTEDDLTASHNYDIVMTFFVFDMYPTQEAKILAQKLSNQLKPSGSWLFADFTLEGQIWALVWKKFMLKLMYSFFRLVSNLQNQALPDYQLIFKELHYYPVKQQYFYQKFIISIIYRKLLS